jgi:hypothetical protein
VGLIGFLQGWDLLRDELGREPGLGEYAARFGVSAETAIAQLEEFESAFPSRSPGEILDLLWAWHESRLKRPAGVPIAEG